jgi:cytochrome c oxidase assembly protein subunit 15
LALILVQFAILAKRGIPSYQTRVNLLLLIVSIAQAIIGVVQARLGVPALLVGLHMLGAAVLCSLLTMQWLAIRGKNRNSVERSA